MQWAVSFGKTAISAAILANLPVRDVCQNRTGGCNLDAGGFIL